MSVLWKAKKHAPLWWVLSLAVFVGLWGCSEAIRPVAQERETGPQLFDNLDTVLTELGTLVTKTLYGSLGGVITADEVELEFPAGAVSGIREVQISRPDPDLPIWDLDISPYSTFSKPVTLTIAYGDLDLDDGPLKVYWLDESRRIWVDMGGVQDSEAQTLSLELEHFSRYAVGGETPPVEGTSGWGRGQVKDSD